MNQENLEDFLEGAILSDKAILERVDEYTLYSYYLGFDPPLGEKFQSPIRVDTHSSFSIFPPASKKAVNEFIWKDNGDGNSGNVFKLVGILHGIKNRETVYRIIDRDFELGFSNGTPIDHQIKLKPKPPYRGTADISIKSRPFRERDLKFWSEFGISKATLDMYNVNALELYWMFKNQQHPTVHADPAYSYRIWSKYKIYRPLSKSKDDKFRNNYTDKHIEGFCQLQYNQDLVIISKSNKENMMFREFGYEAVASHSENNVLSEKVLKYLESKYKHIVVWYDNDGKHQADKYPYDKVEVPIESGEKDPTDFRKKYGHEATYKLLKQLLK